MIGYGELAALRYAEHAQRVLAEQRGRELKAMEAQLKGLLAKVDQLLLCCEEESA